MAIVDRIATSIARVLAAAAASLPRGTAGRSPASHGRTDRVLPPNVRRIGASAPVVLLALAGLAGCAENSPIVKMTDAVLGTTPPPKVTSADHLWSTDPILAYVADATPNETGTVPDPVKGHDVWVEAGPRFHAASGNLCRHYRIVTPSDPTATRYGLACRDSAGDWYRSRLNVNPLAPSRRQGEGTRLGGSSS